MNSVFSGRKIHYTLRLAVGMCFIGHGSFGVITKSVWCNYFAVFGIGHDLAYHLMPWVGSIDIILGVTMLIYPIRAIAAWLMIWGTATALLRPLSGEPVAEFIERAGNFGAPLALLILSGKMKKNIGYWFSQIDPDVHISGTTFKTLQYCLRIIVFLLLCGHSWLNLIGKQTLLDQYAALGFSDTLNVAHTTGLFELAGAFWILIQPNRFIIVLFLVWKIASELLYPQYELFEWIERGGSYCSLFALLLLLPSSSVPSISSHQFAGEKECILIKNSIVS
jgi:hypothetical protein